LLKGLHLNIRHADFIKPLTTPYFVKA